MSDSIEYVRSLDAVEPSDLDGFFVDWPDPPDPETHLRILESSDAFVLAIDREAGQPVGFVTAITDGVLAAYIPLLEVRPAWEGDGIGSRLVEEVCADLDHVYMIDAVCDDDVAGFYRQLGFDQLAGMARRNYDNQSGAD